MSVLLALNSIAYACWKVIPDKDLLKDTQLAVVGTLVDIQEVTSKEQIGGTSYNVIVGTAIIEVEEHLKPMPTQLKRAPLMWRRYDQTPQMDYTPYKGKKMVWLLTAGPAGSYWAQHPLRVRELEDKEKLIKVMRDLNK